MMPSSATFVKRLTSVETLIERGKVLIVYGARQVGKTTLIRTYMHESALRSQYYTGDDMVFAADFGKCDLHIITSMVGQAELIVIDEAHKIPNIGRALKLVVDHFPDRFVIATGSSSFELASMSDEPLTGRKNVVALHPVSMMELAQTETPYQLQRTLEDRLIFGSYPNVITYPDDRSREARITEIKNAYLMQDILQFQGLKKATIIVDLLKLLAFQIGSEVSTSELGRQLGLDGKTVARYLDILEKSFVLFSLGGFSRNLRKEVSKMRKYYFVDTGIRNAVIANFNRLDTRNDAGLLWENFMMAERRKRNDHLGIRPNYYFWRTWDQKEIDLIEEYGGQLQGFEFKWGTRAKAKAPADWLNSYENASWTLITPETGLEFAGVGSRTNGSTL
jgi:uncharacterized protein